MDVLFVCLAAARIFCSKRNRVSSIKSRFLVEHCLLVCFAISRPGILVLINDTDWELEGGLEYTLKNGDTLVFISTLHGG